MDSPQTTSGIKISTSTSTSTTTDDLLPSMTSTTITTTHKQNVTYSSKFVSTWDDDRFKTQKQRWGKPPLKLEPNLDLNQFEEDDEDETEATDHLLGRLRRGINIIEANARETMAGCNSEESKDMEKRLEKSTLQMLKAEKSFLNTSRIISQVVDEFSSDYVHVERNEGNEELDVVPTRLGDSKEEKVRVVFRHDMMNSASIHGFKEKINKAFGERLSTFENGLTENVLREDKKFKDLQRQIRYGRKDAEQQDKDTIVDYPGGEGDFDEEYENDQRVSGTDDEEDYDDSILPCLDPINLKPINTAVTNKHCNHVFDKDSISNRILENPEAKCPVFGCRNKETLKIEDFVLQNRLTEQIRVKNEKLYGSEYFNLKF